MLMEQSMGFTELGLASVLELDHLLSNMLGLSPAAVDRVEPSGFRPYFEHIYLLIGWFKKGIFS